MGWSVCNNFSFKTVISKGSIQTHYNNLNQSTASNLQILSQNSNRTDPPIKRDIQSPGTFCINTSHHLLKEVFVLGYVAFLCIPRYLGVSHHPQLFLMLLTKPHLNHNFPNLSHSIVTTQRYPRKWEFSDVVVVGRHSGAAVKGLLHNKEALSVNTPADCSLRPRGVSHVPNPKSAGLRVWEWGTSG